MSGKIAWFATVAGALILCSLFSYQLGRDSTVVKMGDDRWYTLSTSNGIALLAHNSREEFSLSLVANGLDLIVGYLVGDELEVSFASDMGDSVVTIYDENADGIPEYRLIKEKGTGRVRKEYLDSIVWQEPQ